MSDIVILGAGMAGLGAADRLESEGAGYSVYEKKNYHGGHAATFSNDGFIFDDGPHISFTGNERLREIFHSGVDHEVQSFNPQMNNYWKGYWIKHPAQVNLHGLPTDLVVQIIREIIEVSTKPKIKVENYRDWLYTYYGRTFSETFPIAYAKKYHTISATEMATDWIGPRMYKPEMEEVLRGAIDPETNDVYYVKNFYYPTNGGFVAFLNGLLPGKELHLSHEVTRVFPKTQTLEFKSGFKRKYDQLISSMPLPELICIIEDVPKEVLEAASQLACSTCITVNLGINRPHISDVHWSYFYDKEIIFSRVSYPHKLSPNNVPAGCSSIQAEIYFSKKYKPLGKNPDQYIASTIQDLIHCNILRDDDEIIFREARLIPYANVIFDLDRKQNLRKVHNFLDDVGIQYCGRFGEWGYHWTDDAFLSGEEAAQRVLNQVLT